MFSNFEILYPVFGGYQSTLKRSCVRALFLIMTAQILVVFEIIRFLYFFFNKFSKKNKFIFFFIKKNSLPCSWMLSGYSQGLPILTSNMTAQILLVFLIWRFCDFFQQIFKKNNFTFFSKLKILYPVVGCCQGSFRGCEYCLQIWMLKFLYFLRYTVFCDFFKKVFTKLKRSFFQNLKFSSLYLEAIRLLSGVASLAVNCDCSNLCSYWDITFFVIFSKKLN